MANENQEVSGSPEVNPKPQAIKVKDSAIHWKKIPTDTVPEIIRKSQDDDTDPSATDLQAD